MGKYALYTRPQDGFIDAGSGGGIGWSLIDDITNASILSEQIIDKRHYHTIKEVKNGEGPHPIKTPAGWLHLAHGVRGCAAGLRYVLYLYMTSLEDPTKVIAQPGGYLPRSWGENGSGMCRMCYFPTDGLPMKMERYLYIMHPATPGCM